MKTTKEKLDGRELTTAIFVIKEVRYILKRIAVYKLFKRFVNISFPFPFSLAQTANENETVGAL
jgi:hypothetical protein